MAPAEKEGVKVTAVSCNVLEDHDLVNLIDTATKELGGIYILINNAGGGGRENPFGISVDDIKRDFELNVFSGWRLCQLAVPHMKKAGYGSIVFTTSMSSINKSPNMSGYGGSNAAVNHTVANLVHDFGPEVRINAVGPGATRIDALESVLTPEIEKAMLKHTPTKRLGTADDIVGAMLYFASAQLLLPSIQQKIGFKVWCHSNLRLVVVYFLLSNLRKEELENLFSSDIEVREKFENLKHKKPEHKFVYAIPGITGLAGTLIWGYGDLLF